MFIRRIYVAIGLLIASVALFILHIGALKFYWYWSFWWFDILTHFVGGIIVALFVIYFFLLYTSTEPYISKARLLIISISSVLIIGLIWEAFEVIIGGTSFAERDYMIDTISDLLTDISGGIFIYLIFSVFSKRKLK